MSRRKLIIVSNIIIGIILLTACAQKNSPMESDLTEEKLKVVATTTIVADVVSQVGGDLIELSILLPVGTDPHSFDPTPRDIALIADADVVFANGAGLEVFLENLLESANAAEKVIEVSHDIEYIDFAADHDHELHEGEGESNDNGIGEAEISVDPHTWTDPNNVMVWVKNIADELSNLDPQHAGDYKQNADAYLLILNDLDEWVKEQVSIIPAQNRKIVTDHTQFSYFSRAYGFKQVGALIPGYSSMAEPTARELAQIEDTIKDLDVQAVFVGNTVNPSLSERVAEDTGAQIVFLYTGSLSESDGPASTYVDYTRYNVDQIVEVLK